MRISRAFSQSDLTSFSGMLGASSGYNKEIIIIYRRYKKTKISPGNNAEVNKFPTYTFKTLPSKTKTTEGGII